MQIKSQSKLKVVCNWHFNYLVWILFILFILLNANNSAPLYKYYLHWKSSVPLIKAHNCLATKSNETYPKHAVFIITMYFWVTHKRLWKRGQFKTGQWKDAIRAVWAWQKRLDKQAWGYFCQSSPGLLRFHYDKESLILVSISYNRM